MKLTINHENPSIAQAFVGKDKLNRIEDKLREIIITNIETQTSVSKAIQQGVELYADTVEEAIGIALIISDSMNNARKENEDLPHPLSNIFKNLQHRMGVAHQSHTDRNTDKKEIIQEYGSMKNYMAIQECEECPVNGSCPTQHAADKDDITWREGRKLE